MSNETKFREEVEKAAGIGVSSAEPSRFIRTLIELVDTHARGLSDAVSESGDPEQFKEVTEYADGLIDHGQKVSEELENATFGSFQTLLPVLDYNYPWKVFAARTLRDKYAESLPEVADDADVAIVEAVFWEHRLVSVEVVDRSRD